MPRSRSPRKLFLPLPWRQKPAVGQVQLWVRSPRRSNRWLGLLTVAIGVWAGLGLLLFSLRLGVQMMIAPEIGPSLLRLPSASTEPDLATLEELTVRATKAKERLGEPQLLVLPDSPFRYRLLPIYAPTADSLTEVRLYQIHGSEPEQLQYVAQVGAVPLSETEAFGPLLGTAQAPPLQRRSLPLSQVTSGGQPGWFVLEGRWQRGGVDLRYGRMVYFDSQSQTLEMVATWSSPAAQRPQWTDLDGTGWLDLLVDESADLEPAFQGIQVFEQRGWGPSLRLQPVSLISVPVDSHAGAYRQALTLAQAGLWSDALRQIDPLKAQIEFWPAAAEAQRRLIQHHADRASQQAEQTWASPAQKILAQLIDGRWQAALTDLRTHPEALDALQRILAEDEGRIWNRVSASLRLRPSEQAALVWGGIILQAEKDTSTALAWLDQRQAGSEAKQQLQQALTLAQRPGSRGRSPLALSPQSESLTAEAIADSNGSQPFPAGPVTAAVGTVKPLAQVDGDAWYSEQPLNLDPAQSWYTVDLIAQHQDGWFEPRPAQSAAASWRQWAPMGQSLRLLPGSGAGASIQLQLRGLRQQGTQLTLLASGHKPAQPLAPTALAYSPGSLAWLNPDMGLAAAAQPQLRQGLLAALAKTSIQAGTMAEVVNQALAQGTYYPVKLGDQPGQVLLLDRLGVDRLIAAGVECDRLTPKALIVTADGRVIYNNLLTPETLVAITDIGPTQLLLWSQSGYQLRPL
ncbi:hypothetical protein C7271_16180 [filamentous cyanobacterium CCP5]|nr:hypothetical protein C7271_16180 [filamentous cyanobacterium CCP5]